ncbi:MAG: GntR family transcriptional regulator [Cyanobacteria bacterium]|jgi:GntR family transcriptional regulator|nr:GntR family transcriptional regulator [Cyanobacteria bacterium GSL.Bin21]
MPKPLHRLISEKLRDRIEQGLYQPGEKLPSESQLTQEFKVSRTTIRQAIANLIHQGLVLSYQGKGVFVTEQCKVTYSLSSSAAMFLAQDMANQGLELSVKNLTLELVTPPLRVQTILQLPPQSPQAYLQKKLLMIDGLAGAIDITYTLPEIGDAYGEQFKEAMTFSVLEKQGIMINQVYAVIECTHANAEISQHLAVPVGHPLIVYRHTAYSKDNIPLVQGETISRADRFSYSILISR